MNQTAIKRTIWTTAIITCVIGLFLSAQSFIQIPQRAKKLEDRASDLQLINAIADRAESIATSKNTLSKLPPKKSDSINEILKSTIPANSMEARERTIETLANGWSLRTTDLRLMHLPLNTLPHIVEILEAARPPWRMTQCTIKSSDRVAGQGDITMVLESVQRTSF